MRREERERGFVHARGRVRMMRIQMRPMFDGNSSRSMWKMRIRGGIRALLESVLEFRLPIVVRILDAWYSHRSAI
jgi:hypothetical protein